MSDTTKKRNIESLRLHGGFKANEINQLIEIAKNYDAQNILQATIDRRRLEFMRWLVQTGRLNEQDS